MEGSRLEPLPSNSTFVTLLLWKTTGQWPIIGAAGDGQKIRKPTATTTRNIRPQPDQATTTRPGMSDGITTKRLMTIMVVAIGGAMKTAPGAELHLRMVSVPHGVPMTGKAEVDMIDDSSTINIRTDLVRFSIAMIMVGQFRSGTPRRRIDTTRVSTQTTARTRQRGRETIMSMKRTRAAAAATTIFAHLLLATEIDSRTGGRQPLTARRMENTQRITHIIPNTGHLVRNENKMYTRRIMAIFNRKREGIAKPTNIILASSINRTSWRCRHQGTASHLESKKI